MNDWVDGERREPTRDARERVRAANALFPRARKSHRARLVLVLRPPCRAMFHPDAIQNDPEIERNGSQFAGASAEHDAPSAPARSPPLLPSRD